MVLNLTTKSFDVEFAAPVEVTANRVFLTRVLNSTIDTVHGAFRDPNETAHMSLLLDDTVIEEFDNYTDYRGFRLEDNGGILVTLNLSGSV